MQRLVMNTFSDATKSLVTQRLVMNTFSVGMPPPALGCPKSVRNLRSSSLGHHCLPRFEFEESGNGCCGERKVIQVSEQSALSGSRLILMPTREA